MMTGLVIALAFLTLFLDQYSDIGRLFQEQRFFAIGPQGARTLLATVAGSVIGIAGVSFSITIVALTLASSQFGPRLLNNFMKDVSNQIVLGTFIATFIYCLLVLGSIREAEAHLFVPQISIKVGILLTFISLGVFIYFIHHISVSIHAENVIASVSKDLEKSIHHLFPQKIGQGKIEIEPSVAPLLPPNFEQESQALLSQTSGYLQAIDQQGIMSLATDHDLLIHLKHRPGDFIATGEILAMVWPPHHLDDSLSGGCLGLLAERALPSAYRYDDKHILRVLAHPISMEGLFNAAFNQIRQDGGACVAVGLRLLETFGVLASLTDNPTVQEPIRLHAKMVKEEMLRHVKEGADQKEIKQRYEEIQNLLPPR
jgi:uncharacterized membrane protein